MDNEIVVNNVIITIKPNGYTVQNGRGYDASCLYYNSDEIDDLEYAIKSAKKKRAELNN